MRTALAAAGLGHLADRLDEEAEWNTLLSGGEQQRIGFARALIHQPDVLLLDEAVSTLEDAEARDLYALLSRKTAADDGDLDRPRHGPGCAAPADRGDDRRVGGEPVAAIRRIGSRCPLNRYTRSSPWRTSMLKMNYWTDKWDLDVDVCPCDPHFNEWVAKNKIKNKLIYHFGTGTHHVIGIKQATNKSNNAVLAITASKEEYEAYIELSTEKAKVSKAYVAYFGDIYLTNPKLLPDFDVVTMFHLCEFFFPNTASKSYGGMTDEKLLDLFTAKTKKNGHILFYMGSMAWNKALPIVQKWEKRAPVKRVGEFKTLLVFRKTK